MTKRPFLFFLLISAVVTIVNSQSVRQDIGNFDIAKVRDAVEQEQTALDTAKSQQPAESQAEGWGIVLVRITGYLALVIVLILGVYWILRRSGIVGVSPRSVPVSMDVLETLSMGQGRTIMLVRVMDFVLVLAQTSQNFTLLDKIEGQKALEVISATRGGGSIVQFKDMFSSFLGKMKKPV
jgi:flagellar biogenesis protein FliO